MLIVKDIVPKEMTKDYIINVIRELVKERIKFRYSKKHNRVLFVPRGSGFKVYYESNAKIGQNPYSEGFGPAIARVFGEKIVEFFGINNKGDLEKMLKEISYKEVF